MKLFLNEKLGEISLTIDRSEGSHHVLMLAHGAGAAMDHPFMNQLAHAICSRAVNVVRFNFPYIEKGRKATGSQKDALFTWKHVISKCEELFPNESLFLSGKSYGGRMASHFLSEATDQSIRGIIYFGFPLHAPGKDTKDRALHLSSIQLPQLFIQGTKDKLANIDLMKEVIADLKDVQLELVEDGDHSFKVPKKSGVSQETIMTNIATATSKWIYQMA